MTLELLVCGDYCPITGLRVIGYSEKAVSEKQLIKRRERDRLNMERKRKLASEKAKNGSSNIPT